MQSYGTIGGGFEPLTKFAQSAECAGLLNECDNDNSVRNRDNVETPPVDPPGEFDCEIAISCFVDRLNPTQLASLKGVLGLATDAPNTELCEAIQGMTEAELRAAITQPVVGVTVAVANNIINCLIDEAGFTFPDTEV